MNNEPRPSYPEEPAQAPDSQPSRTESEGGHEQQPTPNPLIYVASLADHEAEHAHGVWLYAAGEPEAVYDDIHRMLGQSSVPGADRFAIHDSEGFGAFRVHDTDSIELVTKVARGIREYGLAYALWAEVNEDSPELLDHFTTAYTGHYESLSAYVSQRVQQQGHESALDQAVPEYMRPFVRIDYEALGEQLFYDGDIMVCAADGGGVWIFDERA